MPPVTSSLLKLSSDPRERRAGLQYEQTRNISAALDRRTREKTSKYLGYVAAC